MELGHQEIQGGEWQGDVRWPGIQEEWALKGVRRNFRQGCENKLDDRECDEFKGQQVCKSGLWGAGGCQNCKGHLEPEHRDVAGM